MPYYKDTGDKGLRKKRTRQYTSRNAKATDWRMFCPKRTQEIQTLLLKSCLLYMITSLYATSKIPERISECFKKENKQKKDHFWIAYQNGR